MFLYSSEEVRKADDLAINELGIPGVVLMENAGLRISDRIMDLYSPYSVCILTGPGNNGGDGFVIARHLHAENIDVRIISSKNLDGIKGDASVNLEAARNLGIKIEESSEITDERLISFIGESDLVVDCLLGTGSSGGPRGEIKRLICLARNASRIVSVDTPSGVNTDSGEVYDPVISADMTFTMIAPKIGLYVMPAASSAGKIEVIPLGVSKGALLAPSAPVFTVEEDNIRSWLPLRPVDMHKGSRGGVMVMGGSSIYKGATILCSLGALSAGSGFVFSAGEKGIAEALGCFLPEVISADIFENEQEPFLDQARYYLSLWQNKAGSVVFGPGSGRDKLKLQLLELLLTDRNRTLVIDGDGLYLLSQISKDAESQFNLIITPHEGEAAILAGVPAEEVKTRRLEYAAQLASRWGVCVLKGASTIVADRKRIAIINAGTQALSVPGSGDVLTGIIASLSVVVSDPFKAAAAGAWLHARAGEKLTEIKGLDGILAREIAETVPVVIKETREKKDCCKI